MFLYHGSTVEIKEIDLNLSKTNKDFGKGFYLSESQPGESGFFARLRHCNRSNSK